MQPAHSPAGEPARIEYPPDAAGNHKRERAADDELGMSLLEDIGLVVLIGLVSIGVILLDRWAHHSDR